MQLSMGVSFNIDESGGSLDEEQLRRHLEQQFQHLDDQQCPTCKVGS